MASRALALLCATAIALAPASAQVRSGALPMLGDGAELTLGAERRLGERIAREIYRDPDYIDDPVLSEYVGEIWSRLLAGAKARGELTPELEQRFAWEIMIGRDRSVNAFALPGGYFGVHLGLVGVVASRDELASVLAHELSHATQRHIARLMTKQNQQSLWMYGALILSALAASKRPDAASAIAAGGQAAAIQGQLNFSRDMEREADRIGYGVLDQAGFETRGFASMFEKLQQAARLNDYGAYPYLRSHPLTTERIADVTSRLPAQAGAGGADALEMQQMMLTSRARSLSQVGVEGLRALIAEAEVSRFESFAPIRKATLLYQASVASLRLRDLPRASAWAARLAPLATADASARRLFDLLSLDLALDDSAPRNASTQAVNLAERMLRGEGFGKPGLRRPELMAASQLLLRVGRASEVAAALRAWIAEHPRDAAAWQLLAEASAAQGQTLRAIRAEAEARAARYDYAAALDRFKAGQEMMRKSGPSAVGGDHLEASIIDTRTRELSVLAREQALER